MLELLKTKAKNIWAGPVGSKVIAGLILYVLVTVPTYLLNTSWISLPAWLFVAILLLSLVGLISILLGFRHILLQDAHSTIQNDGEPGETLDSIPAKPPDDKRNGDANLNGFIKESYFPTFYSVRVRIRFVNIGTETTLSSFRVKLSRPMEDQSWTLAGPTWGDIGDGHRNLAADMQNQQPKYVLRRGFEEDGWLEFLLRPPQRIPDDYLEFKIAVLIEDGFGDIHEISGFGGVLARSR